MNAKQELLEFLSDKSEMKCAVIGIGDTWNEDVRIFKLKVNHSEADLQCFLESLDCDYNIEFDSPNLWGTIWLQDNTWCERANNGNNEWWEHCKVPEIPLPLQ